MRVQSSLAFWLLGLFDHDRRLRHWKNVPCVAGLATKGPGGVRMGSQVEAKAFLSGLSLDSL
jgi:hypothetical protein